MEIARDLKETTFASLKEATAEYFRPLKTLCQWIRSFLNMPAALALASFRLSQLTAAQEELKEGIRRAKRTSLNLPERLLIDASDSRQRYSELAVLVSSPTLNVFEQRDTEQKVVRYLVMAEALRRKGELDRADEVLRLLSKLGERHHLSNTLTYVWFNLGQISFEQRKLSNAEAYFKRIIGAYEIQEAEEVFAAAYSRLAQVYYYQRHFDKTTDYARRALEIVGQFEKEDLLLQSYGRLATVLIELGSSSVSVNELEEAAGSSGSLRDFLLPNPEKLRLKLR